MSRTKHKGNGHDPRHATETPDVSHIKNPDVTHETGDVSVSGVSKFVLALTGLLVLVFVLMLGMFRFLATQEETKEPDPGPMAMSPQERLPPEPRLQAARGFGVKLENGELVNLEMREPEAEYRVLREQWQRQLDCAASHQATSGMTVHSQPPPMTESRTVLCMSIEDAMQKLVQSNPPSRGKTAAEERPGGQTEDYGVDPPTDSSSGRMTEKGKQ